MRDTLMDDARERVDELGEEATQNESLGAALDRAYAARFEGAASSLPAVTEHAQPSSAEPTQPKPAGADDSSPDSPSETARQSGAQQASEDRGQASSVQLASTDGAAVGEPDQAASAASDPMENQQEASGAPEDGPKTQPLEESAQAGVDQQGGAAAAAGVHAVPAEAASAAAAASDSAAAASPAAAEAALATEQAADAPDLLPEQAARRDAEQAQPEQELPKSLDELQRRILDWHWSHLEYGCSAPLHKVNALPPAFASAVAESLVLAPVHFISGCSGSRASFICAGKIPWGSCLALMCCDHGCAISTFRVLGLRIFRIRECC